MLRIQNALVVADAGLVRRQLRAGLESLELRVSNIDASLQSRAEFDAAFATAAKISPPSLVVIAIMPDASVLPCTIDGMSDGHWQQGCRDIIRATLHCLQAAQRHVATDGAAILVLGPSFAFSGSADLVPLSTAAEAQRGLVKSAARQFGARGITVNWVAANAQRLSDSFAGARLPTRAERIPVALGHALRLENEIAPIVTFLASPAGRKITGASLCLDGGEWMLP